MATGGEFGACPDEYHLFRAARYIGCPPWVLAEQSEIWKNWALCFEAAEYRAQEIAAKIDEQRRDVSEGKGKRGEGEEDKAWRQELLAQIEAQGGIVTRKGEENIPEGHG